MLVILTSIVCYFVKDYIGYQVVSFGLLFLVSILALFYGTGPILVAATLSALIWDYFFIPPTYTFHVEKPVDMLMLVMFFIIALMNGTLTSRVRRQEKKIRIREERTDAVYQLTKELTVISGIDQVTKVAINYIQKYFKLDSAIILKNELNQLEKQVNNDSIINLSENEFSVASWTFKHSSKAGKYTNTLPSGNYTFYPLIGNRNSKRMIV